jgi:KUP system potassium uptake protein
MSDVISNTKNRSVVDSSLRAVSLTALGVVLGDIGTSPLYTLKTVLALTGGNPDRAVTLGALSLVIWTLIIVTIQPRINKETYGTTRAILRACALVSSA